jgi:hypothetical protein
VQFVGVARIGPDLVGDPVDRGHVQPGRSCGSTGRPRRIGTAR